MDPGYTLLTFLLFLFVTSRAGVWAKERPHIIFILADDMGWNDVSFHGSNQIPTPNIDALAFNGVTLNSHYVQAICTPSRAALMTGTYPIRTGMQGYPILAAEPRGLPKGKILPQYFKELGYATHAVGKWHLGYHKIDLTPTRRGFDSHLGYWNGFVSYYDYVLQAATAKGLMNGFDLRRNLTSAWDLVGRYATDVFTDEAVNIIKRHDTNNPLFLYLSHLAPHAGNKGKLLEAPQEVVERFSYITDPNRRTYAAMVAKLDESVGHVVQALQRRRMLGNSLIVFLSDNGAPTIGVYPNWGSNWPFRGVKETLWEGGVRGAGVLWSPRLRHTPRCSNQLMHITDWLPTLYSAAGEKGRSLEKQLDGLDQWETLAYNKTSRRDALLLNIDEKTETAAYRYQNWKLVLGSLRNGSLDGYYGDSGKADEIPPYDPEAVVNSAAGLAIAQLMGGKATPPAAIPSLRRAATVRCEGKSASNCWPQHGSSCLFDLRSDPCEHFDVSRRYPRVVRQLRQQLHRHGKELRPQGNLPEDTTGANPARWNNTWTPWVECERDSDLYFCNVPATSKPEKQVQRYSGRPRLSTYTSTIRTNAL